MDYFKNNYFVELSTVQRITKSIHGRFLSVGGLICTSFGTAHIDLLIRCPSIFPFYYFLNPKRDLPVCRLDAFAPDPGVDCTPSYPLRWLTRGPAAVPEHHGFGDRQPPGRSGAPQASGVRQGWRLACSEIRDRPNLVLFGFANLANHHVFFVSHLESPPRPT